MVPSQALARGAVGRGKAAARRVEHMGRWKEMYDEDRGATFYYNKVCAKLLSSVMPVPAIPHLQKKPTCCVVVRYDGRRIERYLIQTLWCRLRSTCKTKCDEEPHPMHTKMR